MNVQYILRFLVSISMLVNQELLHNETCGVRHDEVDGAFNWHLTLRSDSNLPRRGQEQFKMPQLLRGDASFRNSQVTFAVALYTAPLFYS